MTRIICVGNRYRREDDAGPRVYDCLAREALPPGVALHDGGLGGLNLLGLVETAQRVVFVDSVRGYGPPGEVVLLRGPDLQVEPTPAHDHASGVGYLLRVLPHLCEGRLPEVCMVGVEAEADDRAIARAAALVLQQLLRRPPGAPAAGTHGGGGQ